MKQFSGFPARMEFTPVPNLFFSALLPRITDMAELKTTLFVLAALYRKRGYPRFVTYSELLANDGLISSLREPSRPPDEVLRQALKMAVARGTLLLIEVDRDGTAEDAYFMNTESNRQVVTKIQNGELKLTGIKPVAPSYAGAEAQPDIFALYEQNIGLLTPMIAEQLREAEKLYPETWIREAIKEAVNQNKRKWNYISAILEHWSAEGKSDGAHPRYTKADPDKYIKGKYGHMVQR